MILWEGDCLDLMRKIPDKSIDMILCDLPYGTTKCNWDIIIPFEPLWKQYNRIIKNNGAIVLFGRDPFTSKLITSNLKGYKHKWIWNKKQSGSFHLAKYMPLQIQEEIIVFTAKGEKVNYYPIMRKGKMRKKGGAKPTEHFGNSLKQLEPHYSDEYHPVNIIEIANCKNKAKLLHPTQKPVPLLEYLLKTYSKEGEIILDNCMGSGSTGVACINTNRDFIGIEMDKNNFNIAKNVLEEAFDKASFLYCKKEGEVWKQ